MKTLFILIVSATMTFSAGFAQTCDTLFTLQSYLDTPTLYLADTGSAPGYVSGNNVFGDLAKAEGFAAVNGDYVNSVVLYFAAVAISPTDSNNTVTVAVWDNTGTSNTGATGAPGNLLDTVDITLGQIAQAVTALYNNYALEGLLVNFAGGVALTTDTFYVGVFLPTTNGDTIALFTNKVPPGPDGNGWELNAGGGNAWGSYNHDWPSFTGGSVGNYIGVNICSSPSSGEPAAVFTLAPTASNLSNCSPDTVSFTDITSQGPTAWTWLFGDGTSSNTQNPNHVYTSGGSYLVTESATNNVGAVVNLLGGIIQVFANDTEPITVNPSPTITEDITGASSSTSDNGGATINVYSGTPPYFYAWSSDSGSSNILSGVIPGTYSVTVTDYNSCTVSASIVVGISTGINTLSNAVTVSIFPNPAGNQLNIQWSLDAEADVVVYDVTGSIVKSFTIQGAALNTFDIQDLASGAYILRITDRQTSEQRSLLFTKL